MVEKIVFLGKPVSVKRAKLDKVPVFEFECAVGDFVLQLKRRTDDGFSCAALLCSDPHVGVVRFASWYLNNQQEVRSDFRSEYDGFWLDLAYSFGFNIPVVRYEPYKEEGFR